MNLVRFATIGLLLGLGQQGFAGMIPDPAQISLLGTCNKSDPVAITFDEQGNLNIDLSALPLLTPENRSFTCQLKIPYTADTKVLAGGWHLEAKYHQGQGSRMVSTVRFARPGEVNPAKVWTLDEATPGELSWNEAWSLPLEQGDEHTLKITWTHELKVPPKDDKEPSKGCAPWFKLKRLTLAAKGPAPEPTPSPTPSPTPAE